MTQVVTALTAAAVGAFVTIGAVIAQAAGNGNVDTLAPFFQAGGTVSAVGALIYTVRQLVNGNLVAKPVAEVQTEMAAHLQTAFKREEILATLRSDAGKREDALSLTLDKTSQLLGRVAAELERRPGV